jgi:uncharacterized protein
MMHDHALHAAVTAGPALETLPLLFLLFATGLWGSFSHCAGMCGPFVLTQVDQALSQTNQMRWGRVRGAALVPYHLGRMTTYAGLGAVSGSLGGALTEMTGLRWLAAGLLLLAATLFAAQAIGLPALRGFRAPPFLAGLVGQLSRSPSGWTRYTMGVALGFLPCGLLYGAFTLAAATGEAAAGALGMAAFALGTVPALVMVGWGGVLLGVRRRQALQRLTRPMLAVNAVVLALLALGIGS